MRSPTDVARGRWRSLARCRLDRIPSRSSGILGGIGVAVGRGSRSRTIALRKYAHAGCAATMAGRDPMFGVGRSLALEYGARLGPARDEGVDDPGREIDAGCSPPFGLVDDVDIGVGGPFDSVVVAPTFEAEEVGDLPSHRGGAAR